MYLLTQIGKQIPSLGRQQGIIQRNFAVCLRYHEAH